MYYYSHHIGDFISDTARLTDSQCMAYLRLIWAYYDTEKPLENDVDSLAFKIGSTAQDVALILKHYFVLGGNYWVHDRCEKVIAEYHSRADKARKSANARWSNAKVMRTHSERNANESISYANQQPITNNQQPIDKDLKDITSQATGDDIELPKTVKPKTIDYPDWFESIWRRYPDRAGGDNKKTAFQKASARLKEGATAAQMFTAVERYRRYVTQTGKLGTEFVKQAATFFGTMENITNNWAPPAIGANHASQPKSAIERFMQQHYPDQGTGPENDNGFMGGNDGAIRGQVDSVVWGASGQDRPMVANAEWNHQDADSSGFERD